MRWAKHTFVLLTPLHRLPESKLGCLCYVRHREGQTLVPDHTAAGHASANAVGHLGIPGFHTACGKLVRRLPRAGEQQKVQGRSAGGCLLPGVPDPPGSEHAQCAPLRRAPGRAGAAAPGFACARERGGALWPGLLAGSEFPPPPGPRRCPGTRDRGDQDRSEAPRAAGGLRLDPVTSSSLSCFCSTHRFLNTYCVPSAAGGTGWLQEKAGRVTAPGPPRTGIHAEK